MERGVSGVGQGDRCPETSVFEIQRRFFFYMTFYTLSWLLTFSHSQIRSHVRTPGPVPKGTWRMTRSHGPGGCLREPGPDQRVPSRRPVVVRAIPDLPSSVPDPLLWRGDGVEVTLGGDGEAHLRRNGSRSVSLFFLRVSSFHWTGSSVSLVLGDSSRTSSHLLTRCSPTTLHPPCVPSHPGPR